LGAVAYGYTKRLR